MKINVDEIDGRVDLAAKRVSVVLLAFKVESEGTESTASNVIGVDQELNVIWELSNPFNAPIISHAFNEIFQIDDHVFRAFNWHGNWVNFLGETGEIVSSGWSK